MSDVQDRGGLVIELEIETEITTRHPRKDDERLRLPSGWSADVPEIQPEWECAAVQSLVNYEAQGLNRREAEAAVAETLREKWTQDWRADLLGAMRYYMRTYARRHPEAVRPDGSLAGFDPERASRWWVPGENTGRRGKTFLVSEMAEMAKETQ